MVAPIGGDKDLYPPKLLNIESSKNKLGVNIKFEFDEYIQLNKWDEYFYVSPPINNRIQKKIQGSDLVINIEDSLAKHNYYIALNYCIKDNNEGNLLDSLTYNLSLGSSLDTLVIMGNLRDAYTLAPMDNFWIMLFNYDISDSLIFKQAPNYVAKTDKNGFFEFSNLSDTDYQVVALSGMDFIYDHGEKIGFLDDRVRAGQDSFISFFAFDPEFEIKGGDSLVTNSDSIIANYFDQDSTLQTKEKLLGRLEIITNAASNCIFQLLQNEEVIKEIYFPEHPYLLDDIVAGSYNLKYIEDANQDSVWTTGNWHNKLQPEKVVNYPEEIIIRFNWDLNLDWIIGE